MLDSMAGTPNGYTRSTAVQVLYLRTVEAPYSLARLMSG